MQTLWNRAVGVGRKTGATLSMALCLLGATVSCTSSRDSPALETTEPQRVYRPTPTSRDMSEQSSIINRKINIEERPNDPANQPPAVRSQRILPGRQPVVVDTVSTRAKRDSLRRKQ